MRNKSYGAFTLLEVLLVIALIAILASIVITAINPGKQLADGRNAQRRVDINTILNAVYQYSVDNRGNLPGTPPGNIPIVSTNICTTGGVCGSLVDLSTLTNSERYIVSMPTDPSVATANDTGYSIKKDSFNRVTVSAPNAEQGITVTATR